MCHVLWLMPLLGLPLFWILDFSVALPLYLGILALSGVVMLLTVWSIRQPPSSGIEGMHGDVAEVVEALRPHGTVRYHNQFWYAKAREPIDVGERVCIVGNEGLCLLVTKLSQAQAGTANTGHHSHIGPRHAQRG